MVKVTAMRPRELPVPRAEHIWRWAVIGSATAPVSSIWSSVAQPALKPLRRACFRSDRIAGT